MKSRTRLLTGTVPLTLAAIAAAACASAAPHASYNPVRLGGDQLTQVEQICQNVMGLDPAEPLIWGMHTGVMHLDTWTSHYRGCVLSLSATADSLGGVDPPPTITVQAPAPSRSFYSASNREIASRELLACAQLGLQPHSAAHDACVRQLKRTFFAIDNPVT
jgi:hypothetical protein